MLNDNRKTLVLKQGSSAAAADFVERRWSDVKVRQRVARPSHASLKANELILPKEFHNFLHNHTTKNKQRLATW